MLSNSQKLKRLQTGKSDLVDQLSEVKTRKKDLAATANSLISQIAKIDNEIEKLSSKQVIISEHAILRYIERVYGIDLEDIKTEILADGRKSAIEFAKTGKFKINDKHTLVVKDGVIVTVM